MLEKSEVQVTKEEREKQVSSKFSEVKARDEAFLVCCRNTREDTDWERGG